MSPENLPNQSPEEATDSSEHDKPFSSSSGGLKWKILTIIFFVTLVVIGGFYAYGFYQDKLNEQFSNGWIQGQRDYVIQQTQSGEVIYISNHTGNLTFETTTFAEICGGGQ